MSEGNAREKMRPFCLARAFGVMPESRWPGAKLAREWDAQKASRDRDAFGKRLYGRR